MSHETIELPDSLKNCLPCQEKVITSHLIALCKVSKELSANIDCMGLAQEVHRGEKTTQEAIKEIVEHSKGTTVQEAVDKITHILDEKKEE